MLVFQLISQVFWYRVLFNFSTFAGTDKMCGDCGAVPERTVTFTIFGQNFSSDDDEP